MRDDSRTRDSKPFRQFFSSAPAIDDNADPEKYHTENSNQDSRRKNVLKRIPYIHDREDEDIFGYGSTRRSSPESSSSSVVAWRQDAHR